MSLEDKQLQNKAAKEVLDKRLSVRETEKLAKRLARASAEKSERNEKIRHHSNQKRDMIYDALMYIEEHLDAKIDFSSLAEKSFMSPSYFRSIFKDVTGLTPVEYLNRMRIVKSLKYLELDKSTIADAAAKVGIFDSNYFSRMFKKVMGYSPKYFKSIRN